MLAGIRVLEFEGLVPSIFCGMILADQGAQVIIAARKQPAPFSITFENNTMHRFKKCISVDFKNQEDRTLLKQLIRNSDIIIDPYRPGVLEKLHFGPSEIFLLNPKTVLLRVSGYGQSNDMALRPGHDLNYLAVSGIMPLINHSSGKNTSELLQFPANYLADFVSASLGITATIAALKISDKTGIGRIVDCSLAEGCKYYTNVIMQNTPIQEQKSKTQMIKYRKNNGKLYCITHKMTSNQHQAQLQSQIDHQITIMNNNNIKYKNYEIKEVGTIQISQMQQLMSYQQQSTLLNNVFDSDSKIMDENKSITTRGRQDQQIRGIYQRKMKIRAKL